MAGHRSFSEQNARQAVPRIEEEAPELVRLFLSRCTIGVSVQNPGTALQQVQTVVDSSVRNRDRALRDSVSPPTIRFRVHPVAAGGRRLSTERDGDRAVIRGKPTDYYRDGRFRFIHRLGS